MTDSVLLILVVVCVVVSCSLIIQFYFSVRRISRKEAEVRKMLREELDNLHCDLTEEDCK